MAEVGIAMVSKLIEVFGNDVIKQTFEMWGYKSQLEELKETVKTINSLLLDADSKENMFTAREQGYIKKLKDAVYDAEDVFEEFLTLAELNQLGDQSKFGRLFAKVQRFFSCSKNQVSRAYRMSRDVKDIKRRLDLIADDHKRFGFNVEYNPIVQTGKETCSLIGDEAIIGREDDKEAIVGMLLGPNVNANVGFVTIVGMGGLGKTVLAQLVYDDERIKKEFCDLRLWVCVSDQERKLFDERAILCKILELLTKEKIGRTLQLVQNQLREKLNGKKYFLVLDDVWNEDPKKWKELKKFLRFGERGSRVLVTTRSERTSKSIGDDNQTYMLDGLSQQNSWRLFKVLALKEGKENHHEFVKIGEKIVEKFDGNPLAISVVGSFLANEDVDKWQAVEKSGLHGIGSDGDEIVSILKLSYYNLTHSLKSCFSFCALFPKDTTFEKEMLINLWIAQGYIVPKSGQSIEDAGEEHLLLLLQRRFFEIKVMSYRMIYEVEVVKFHDLMHDLAREVRGDEVLTMTSRIPTVEYKVRHLNFDGDRCPDSSLYDHKLRSLICKLDEEPSRGIEIGNWKYLRVLDLSFSSVKSLPNSMGNLLLLRYLNLSFNKGLETLCEEITKLHNLHTLLLRGCYSLTEFPRHFRKLVKLRHLDLHGCSAIIQRLDEVSLLKNLSVLDLSSMGLTCLPNWIGNLVLLRHLNLSFNDKLKVVSDEITKLHSLQTLLLQGCSCLKHLPRDFTTFSKLRHFDLRRCGTLTHMPLGMEKLTSLSFLPYFVVGMKNSTETERVDELKSLKALTMIKGKILIRVGEYYRKVEGMNDTGEGYLKSSTYVKDLTIIWEIDEGIDRCVNTEAGLVSLEPHPNLEKLSIWYYPGTRIPRWGRAEDNWALSFPRLVFICLYRCFNLQEMPVLSKLPHLKTLVLISLANLEYMEIRSNHKETSESAIFFPSLKRLKISYLKKLKRWWKGEASGVIDDNCSKSKLIFPCLSALHIHRCQSLTSFPLCPPTLEKLRFTKNNEMLEIRVKTRGEEFETTGTSQDYVKLRELEADGVPKNMSQVFEKCGSSLKILKIGRMSDLRRLSGGRGFHNFTALDSLSLGYYTSEDEDDDILWKSFPPSLHFMKVSLTMKNMPKGMQYLTSLQTLQLRFCHDMEALPEWIECLSSLQYLSIEYCSSLKSLPEAMKSLTSLKTLVIFACRKLEKRCKNLIGEDWPKIKHIPDIRIERFDSSYLEGEKYPETLDIYISEI